VLWNREDRDDNSLSCSGLREDLAEKTERGVLALMSVFFPHDVGFVISETTAN
jgi:hypothetical protein